MIRFLKLPFSLFWKLLTTLQTLFFGLIALLVVIALIAAPFSEQGPTVADSGAMVLNLSGYVVEQRTAVDPLDFLSSRDLPQEVLLSDVLEAVTQARDDARITTLVLDLDDFYGALMPHLELIGDEIAAFRQSGKKVIAASRSYSQSALLLAVEADEVIMDPEYAALPEGFSAYRTYFKGFLERFNITVNLFKVGQYKSAVEPYIRDSMSEEDKEARLAYLKAWWSTYTQRIERRRDMAPGDLDNIIDNVEEVLETADGNLAQLAINTGLVDRLLTEQQRDEYLIETIGKDAKDEKRFQGIGYQDYLAVNEVETEKTESKIAVITAVGSIIDGPAEAGTIGSLSLLERIEQARNEDDVKAIVLRIDSGGGSKSASEVIRLALAEAQDDGIPVVASMGSVAASGGYWIAASADKIFAHPNTITGSIGIFGLIPTLEGVLGDYGIQGDGVSTTPLAGGISIDRGVTPLYGRLLERIIKSGYDQFLRVVADGRGMTIEAVDAVAQGRVWTGAAAQPLGLVDTLGGLDDAVAAAAEIAGVDTYTTWHVEPEPSRRQQIIDALTTQVQSFITPSPSATLPYLKAIEGAVSELNQFNDPHHVYVVCESCPSPRDF